MMNLNVLKKTRTWLLIAWVFYVCLLVTLSRQLNLITENLTGLSTSVSGWLMMASFSIITSMFLLIGSLMTKKFENKRPAKILLGVSCFLMAVSPLIPYWENQAWLKDLHVWGGILGVITYQICWLFFSHSENSQFDLWINPLTWLLSMDPTIKMQLIIIGISWLIICFCGHISGLSEIGYGFMEVSFLVFYNVFHK